MTNQKDGGKRPEVHTTPNPNGEGWVNQSGGEVHNNHNKKEPAKEEGRGQAKSEKTEHVIHNQKGQIQEKNSYGNDPVPPRDQK